MKKFRQILSCVLALVMCASVVLCTPAYAVTDTRNEAFSSFRSDLVIPADQRDNLNQFIEFSLSPAVPGGVTTLTAFMHNNGRLTDESGKVLQENNLWGIVMDIDYGDLVPVEGTTDKYGRTFPKWTKGNPYNSRENFDANAYISPLKLNGVKNPNLKSGRLTYGFHYEYPKCRVSGQMFTIDFLVPENVDSSTNLTVKVDKSTFKNTSAVQCLDYPDASGNNAAAIGNNFSFVSDTVELDYIETPVVSAVQSSKEAITVSWNSCFNAKSYNVYRATAQTEEFELVATDMTDTTYVDTDLQGSGTYSYYVEALNDNCSVTGTSEYVSTDFFCISESPVISAYGKNGKIKVEVDSSIYMNDGIEVLYSTKKDMSDAISFDLDGEETAEFEVQANTLYYVCARSYKAVGSQTYYSQLSEPTLVYTSDAPHITYAYMNEDGSIELSWTKVADAQVYEVVILDAQGNPVYSTEVSGTSAVLTEQNGVKLGTGQSYVVKANGTSSLPATEVVAPPQIKGITNDATNAVVISLNVTQGNTYSVLRSVNGAEFEQIEFELGEDVIIDNSAKQGGTYAYKIKEYSARFEKESEYSDTVSISLLADDATVSGFDAQQITKNTVYLAWNALENADSYTVSRSTDAANFAVVALNITATEYTDTTANENKTYYYQVVANSGNFVSLPSNASIEVDNNYPQKPAVTAKQVGIGKVALEWGKLENATNIVIARWSENTEWQNIATLQATASSYTDTGLTQGNYQYIVSVYGEKEHHLVRSEQVEIVVNNKTLSTPKISSAKYVKKNQIRVNYNKVSGADSYELYRKIGSGKYVKIKTVSAKYSYITDKTAKKAGTYYYKVKAVNKTQSYLSSSLSSAKKIKAMNFSYKAKFKLTKGAKAFTFTFKSKHKNADGFQIQYSTKESMKKAKYVTLKASAKSKKVVKLKAKTTYYVRVRAYKKINGKKVYSVYSAKLKVKTK